MGEDTPVPEHVPLNKSKSSIVEEEPKGRRKTGHLPRQGLVLLSVLPPGLLTPKQPSHPRDKMELHVRPADGSARGQDSCRWEGGGEKHELEKKCPSEQTDSFSNIYLLRT